MSYADTEFSAPGGGAAGSARALVKHIRNNVVHYFPPQHTLYNTLWCSASGNSNETTTEITQTHTQANHNGGDLINIVFYWMCNRFYLYYYSYESWYKYFCCYELSSRNVCRCALSLVYWFCHSNRVFYLLGVGAVEEDSAIVWFFCVCVWV